MWTVGITNGIAIRNNQSVKPKRISKVAILCFTVKARRDAIHRVVWNITIVIQRDYISLTHATPGGISLGGVGVAAAAEEEAVT
jgi:hypothetical protein